MGFLAISVLSGFKFLPKFDKTSSLPTQADGVCQTVWHRAVWQTASGSARHCVPDAVCQTVWQTRRLADSICKTVSGRHCLPDGVCQMPHLADAVSGRRGVCRQSGRRPSAALCQTVWTGPSGKRRLPDSPPPDCLADTASGRRRLADTVLQTPSELV